MMVYDDDQTGTIPGLWSLLFDLAAAALGAGAVLIVLRLLGELTSIQRWGGLV